MLIIILRALILYFVVVFTLRLMGKKQLGELQPSELVTTIMVSNIATISLENPSASMVAGIIPILAIACFDVFMSAATLRRTRMRKIVTGSPRVIILNGVINQAELRELRYTPDDLFEAMHDGGLFDLSEIEFAVVETTGKINFCVKGDCAGDVRPPAAVIKDGVVDEAELGRCGYGRGWVAAALCADNIAMAQVYLMLVRGKDDYDVVRLYEQDPLEH